MTEKIQQTIKEELEKLPKEIQEAINTFDWIKFTIEIGKNHLLSEEDIDSLQIETLLVLVGLVDLDLYKVNIEDEIGTTREEAKKIAEEIYQKVFTPITNIVEENAKKNLKNKNPDWKQNLNFTLSGGNYAAFIEKNSNQPTPNSSVPTKPKTLRDNLVI